MKKIIYILVLFIGVSILSNSCVKDLDLTPVDPDEVTSATVFENPESYTQFLAKCYAGLAVGGQQGGDGQADISGIDGGFSQYLRQYWYHQELTTDEAVIGWDDATIKDFHWHQWGDGDTFIAAMYYRIYYQISLCNEYLRQTTDDLLDDRGVTDDWREKITYYRAEIRFLRALSYWHVLDMFGNGVPFVVETDPIGDFFPPAISKDNLFSYIESELKSIENSLYPAPHPEYGRADQAAAQMVLAKLYLNAEVYIGQNRYSDCITYCDKIISGPYSLAPTFQQLFWANNDQDVNTMKEIIFPIRYDGAQTQTWGGTTFIIAASIGGSMTAQDYGTAERWGGTRTTKEFVSMFSGDDSRAMFYTDGQNLEIEDIGTFEEGYAVTKFRNVYYENGVAISGSNETHMDTDFPMFRLADVYLMYAEAVVRGGGGNAGQALDYMNALRNRVDATPISGSDLTLDFIIDERARELYWECHRRTDLIRFNKLTGGNYIWTWKGNIKEGRSTDAKYNLFPLPAQDVNANPNISQNPNY
ncbi:MAG: RagB/SusD family nutrient uptake outer membrane protein [Bacteroidales bacterium]